MKIPEAVTTRLKILSSMWLSIAGLAAITWGVCEFLLPLGLITAGTCALLLDRAIDAELKGGCK